MATIKRYTQGIVRQRPVANIVDTQALQRAGGAARALGGLSGLGADLINKHIQANETTAVNNAVIQKKKQTLDARISGQQERSNNPFGWAKDFNESITKADEELLKSLPSEAARQAAKDTFANINLQNYEKSLIWENNQATKIYAERTEEAARTLNDLSYQAGADGGTLDDILRDIDATTASVATYQNDRFVLEQSNKTMTRNAVRSYIQGQMSQAVTVEDAKALQEQYGSDQIRDLIGNKEADEFVQSAKDLEEAIINDQFKRGAYTQMQQLAEQNAFRSSVLYDQNISSAQKILQLSQMELEGKITSGFASDAKSVINSLDAVAEGEEPTEIEKLEAYEDLQGQIYDLALDEDLVDGITTQSLNKYESIQKQIDNFVSSKKVTRAEARSLMLPLDEMMSKKLASNAIKKESFLQTRLPGVQDPTAFGLRQINKFLDKSDINSIQAKKELFVTYSNLLGKIDKDGKFNPNGEYKSTGSDKADERILLATLEEAKRQVNQKFTRIRDVSGKPVDVEVPKFGGVFSDEKEAQAFAEQNGWNTPYIIRIGNRDYRWEP